MKLEAIGALNCGPVAMDANGNLRAINNQELPTEEEIQAKIAELVAAEPMRQLREKRNQLLAQTDWMAVSDRIMSPEQIAYRQSLRDMPANNPDVALNDAGELINVTWPTEPTT